MEALCHLPPDGTSSQNQINLLLALWLCRHPESVQETITDFSSMTHEDLATKANKVLDVHTAAKRSTRIVVVTPDLPTDEEITVETTPSRLASRNPVPLLGALDRKIKLLPFISKRKTVQSPLINRKKVLYSRKINQSATSGGCAFTMLASVPKRESVSHHACGQKTPIEVTATGKASTCNSVFNVLFLTQISSFLSTRGPEGPSCLPQ